jgi:hypothetical protein
MRRDERVSVFGLLQLEVVVKDEHSIAKVGRRGSKERGTKREMLAKSFGTFANQL